MKSFEQIAGDMRSLGMKLPAEKITIAIPDAAGTLKAAMDYFIGLENRTLQWLPEYDRVAEWLAGNRGRGLFLFGSCGRGKSVLCRYAIPAILLHRMHKVASVYDVQEMNRDLDTVLSKHIISLDDIGTEEMSVKYGERRLAFAEIMDAAEKYGKLLIVSTNLSAEQLRKQYGDRVVDRIRSTMWRIPFNGESLRK